MLIHAFAFRWRDGATPEDRERAVAQIAAFAGRIEGLVDVQVGANLSPQRLGYETGGVLRFVDRAAFAAYGDHPLHRALLDWLLPLIDPVEIDLDTAAPPQPPAGRTAAVLAMLGAVVLATVPVPGRAAPLLAVHQPMGRGVHDLVSVELDGPELEATRGINPFADYRLDVTFAHGADRWTVPGYFAGCADAADRPCDGGRRWVARFIPSRSGTWRYTVRFRTGPDLVATGAAGMPVPLLDGATGTFTVTPAARNAVRARGILHYTGESLYRWSGSGRVAFKIGPDSPENTLAFADFDHTPDSPPPRNLIGISLGIEAKGLRKTWLPHLADFPASARRYLWQSGTKGGGLLGAFAYLRGAGANTVSMLLFNVGGDDKNVVPPALKVDPAAYAKLTPRAQWDEGVYKDRYDLSKLAQWQRALSYADEIGLRLHFKLMEVEDDRFMDGGHLGRERRIYLREMVARFGAFLAPVWNLGEENDQDAADLVDAAGYLATLDPYRHPIVQHTYPQEKDRYRAMLGTRSALTGLSLQGLAGTLDDVRPDILKWSRLAREEGRPVVVGYDELGGPFFGAPMSAGTASPALKELPPKFPAMLRAHPDRATYRRKAIWNALTAGAEGIEVYYGFLGGCGDLDCQDHRSRAEVWQDGARAVRFFETYVGERALAMRPDDALSGNPDDYVLAQPGVAYVIYATAARPVAVRVDGRPGRYRIDWFDPAVDGPLRTGSVPTVTTRAPSEIARLGDPPARIQATGSRLSGGSAGDAAASPGGDVRYTRCDANLPLAEDAPGSSSSGKAAARPGPGRDRREARDTGHRTRPSNGRAYWGGSAMQAGLKTTISMGALALAIVLPTQGHAQSTSDAPAPQSGQASSESSAIKPDAPSQSSQTGQPITDPNAPPTEGGTLTDVIVTAQKRAESISKAPLAVSAIGQQAFDRLGAENFQDVLKTVPSLAATTNGLSIRGLGGTTTNGFGAGTVAFHIDGIYLPETAPVLYDIDRIEVLRGPQGTLYGRNSTAGVVNVITAKPVDRLSAMGDLATGDGGRMTARGVINVPIFEGLSVRASGTYDYSTGTQFNPGDDYQATGVISPGKRGDALDHLTGRLAVRFKPIERFELNVNVTYDQDRDRMRLLVPGYYANFPNVTQPVTFPVTISPALPAIRLIVAPGNADYSNAVVYPSNYPKDWTFTPAGSSRIGSFTDRNTNHADIFAVRSDAKFDVTDSFSVSYLFGYRYKRDLGRSQTVPFAANTQNLLFHEYSNEVDFNYEGSRLHAVLGLYSFLTNAQNDTYVSVFTPSLSTGATAPFTPPVLNPAVNVGSKGKYQRQLTQAAFGQATLDVTDRLRITGGARYNRDRVSATAYSASLCPFGLGTSNDNVDPTGTCALLAGLPNIAYAAITSTPITSAQLTGAAPFPASFNPFTTGRIVPAADTTFTKASFKGTVEYDFTKDVLGYATVATGYKAGGIGDQTQTGDARFYSPETDINYEVGIRSKLLENRLSLNLTGFWTDYDNLQVAEVRVIAGRPTTVISNAARARSRGVEFEFGWAISPRDRLTGYATYLDARIKDYFNVPDVFRNITIANISGNRLANSPELALRGVYSHIVDLGARGSITPTLQGQYQSKSYTSYLNNIEEQINPYFVGTVSVRYETASRKFFIEGILNNVTDKRYVQSDFPVSGGGVQLLRYAEGRSFLGRIGVKF